jgi:hypothetical protein
MADITQDKNRRSRVHLTVAALLVLAVLMFISAAWLRLA